MTSGDVTRRTTPIGGFYSQTSYHIEMSNWAVKGRRQSRRNDPFRDRGP